MNSNIILFLSPSPILPANKKSGPYGPLVFALSVTEHLEDIVKVVILA